MKPNKIIAGIVTILMIFATAQTTAAQTQRYGGGRFGNRENSSDNRGNATVQPQSRTQTQNQNNNAATRTQQPAQQTPRNAAPQQQQRGFAPPAGPAFQSGAKIFVLTHQFRTGASTRHGASERSSPLSGERTPSRPFRTSPHGTTPRLSPQH